MIKVKHSIKVLDFFVFIVYSHLILMRKEKRNDRKFYDWYVRW
jgi:hypothetical protein